MNSENKLKTDQRAVINEMAQANAAKIKLREKRICIENGIISLGKPPKAVEQNNEIEIMMKKSKVIEELNEKNKNRIIGKITDKEKRMAQVEAEISILQEELKNKTKENEKLSIEAKELKKMIPKKLEKDEKEFSVNEELLKEDDHAEENDEAHSNRNSVEL